MTDEHFEKAWGTTLMSEQEKVDDTQKKVKGQNGQTGTAPPGPATDTDTATTPPAIPQINDGMDIVNAAKDLDMKANTKGYETGLNKDDIDAAYAGLADQIGERYQKEREDVGDAPKKDEAKMREEREAANRAEGNYYKEQKWDTTADMERIGEKEILEVPNYREHVTDDQMQGWGRALANFGSVGLKEGANAIDAATKALGEFRKLTRAFLSPNPMSAASQMLASTMVGMNTMYDTIDRAGEIAGIKQGADRSIVMETAKGAQYYKDKDRATQAANFMMQAFNDQIADTLGPDGDVTQLNPAQFKRIYEKMEEAWAPEIERIRKEHAAGVPPSLEDRAIMAGWDNISKQYVKNMREGKATAREYSKEIGEHEKNIRALDQDYNRRVKEYNKVIADIDKRALGEQRALDKEYRSDMKNIGKESKAMETWQRGYDDAVANNDAIGALLRVTLGPGAQRHLKDGNAVEHTLLTAQNRANANAHKDNANFTDEQKAVWSRIAEYLGQRVQEVRNMSAEQRRQYARSLAGPRAIEGAKGTGRRGGQADDDPYGFLGATKKQRDVIVNLTPKQYSDWKIGKWKENHVLETDQSNSVKHRNLYKGAMDIVGKMAEEERKAYQNPRMTPGERAQTLEKMEGLKNRLFDLENTLWDRKSLETNDVFDESYRKVYNGMGREDYLKTLPKREKDFPKVKGKSKSAREYNVLIDDYESRKDELDMLRYDFLNGEFKDWRERRNAVLRGRHLNRLLDDQRDRLSTMYDVLNRAGKKGLLPGHSFERPEPSEEVEQQINGKSDGKESIDAAQGPTGEDRVNEQAAAQEGTGQEDKNKDGVETQVQGVLKTIDSLNDTQVLYGMLSQVVNSFDAGSEKNKLIEDRLKSRIKELEKEGEEENPADNSDVDYRSFSNASYGEQKEQAYNLLNSGNVQSVAKLIDASEGIDAVQLKEMIESYAEDHPEKGELVKDLMDRARDRARFEENGPYWARFNGDVGEHISSIDDPEDLKEKLRDLNNMGYHNDRYSRSIHNMVTSRLEELTKGETQKIMDQNPFKHVAYTNNNILTFLKRLNKMDDTQLNHVIEWVDNVASSKDGYAQSLRGSAQKLLEERGSSTGKGQNAESGAQKSDSTEILEEDLKGLSKEELEKRISQLKGLEQDGEVVSLLDMAQDLLKKKEGEGARVDEDVIDETVITEEGTTNPANPPNEPMEIRTEGGKRWEKKLNEAIESGDEEGLNKVINSIRGLVNKIRGDGLTKEELQSLLNTIEERRKTLLKERPEGFEEQNKKNLNAAYTEGRNVSEVGQTVGTGYKLDPAKFKEPGDDPRKADSAELNKELSYSDGADSSKKAVRATDIHIIQSKLDEAFGKKSILFKGIPTKELYLNDKGKISWDGVAGQKIPRTIDIFDNWFKNKNTIVTGEKSTSDPKELRIEMEEYYNKIDAKMKFIKENFAEPSDNIKSALKDLENRMDLAYRFIHAWDKEVDFPDELRYFMAKEKKEAAKSSNPDDPNDVYAQMQKWGTPDLPEVKKKKKKSTGAPSTKTKKKVEPETKTKTEENSDEKVSETEEMMEKENSILSGIEPLLSGIRENYNELKTNPEELKKYLRTVEKQIIDAKKGTALEGKKFSEGFVERLKELLKDMSPTGKEFTIANSENPSEGNMIKWGENQRKKTTAEIDAEEWAKDPRTTEEKLKDNDWLLNADGFVSRKDKKWIKENSNKVLDRFNRNMTKMKERFPFLKSATPSFRDMLIKRFDETHKGGYFVG